jgi:alkyl hydroperoxide reductase subunit AhpF
LGFFTAAKQGRQYDAELGKGLWRRAHDRFHRGLDRYHQVLEGVEDQQLYDELVEIANELAALSPRVRLVCAEAQRRSPSDGLDIPGQLAGVHRSLSKAGNSLATTAEAAAMLRLAVGPVPVGAASVRRRAEAVFEQVIDAERRLGEDPTG